MTMMMLGWSWDGGVKRSPVTVENRTMTGVFFPTLLNSFAIVYFLIVFEVT